MVLGSGVQDSVSQFQYVAACEITTHRLLFWIFTTPCKADLEITEQQAKDFCALHGLGIYGIEVYADTLEYQEEDSQISKIDTQRVEVILLEPLDDAKKEEIRNALNAILNKFNQVNIRFGEHDGVLNIEIQVPLKQTSPEGVVTAIQRLLISLP